MRLTLRTLLAYLDNTLDPQDAESLRIKLTESGFATQLVQRIRAVLENPMLSAPLPGAAGPIEDPNAISEYLDSTLQSEQVAEIERACLESDPHLAEAAACHQILTMVLGRPAEVSPELRNRIYRFPDRELDQIGTAASIASLDLGAEPGEAAPRADDIPTADATMNPVQPVGAGDSGVSDAPTRLREMGVAEDRATKSRRSVGLEPVLAGSKPRALTESQIYGGSIRPSRITPWLVSLAVVGVLLFVLAQIFGGLLTGDPSLADSNVADGEAAEMSVSPEPPAMIDDGTGAEQASASDVQPPQPAASEPVAEPTGAETEAAGDVATNPEPAATPPTATAVEPGAAAPVEPAPVEPAAVETATIEPVPGEPLPGDAPVATNTPVPDPPRDEESAASPAAGADMTDEVASTPATTGPNEPAATIERPPTTGDAQPVPSDAEAAPPVPQQQVGKLTSTSALVAALRNDEWEMLNKGAPLESNAALVCAPTYRCELTTNDNIRATILGPGRVQWHLDPDGALVLQVDFGRLVLEPLEPDATARLLLGGEQVSIQFSDASDLAAVDLAHVRRPGSDPFDPKSHHAVRSVTARAGRDYIVLDRRSNIVHRPAMDDARRGKTHGDRPGTTSRLGSAQ